MSGPTSSITVHCPHCQYNLTGLTRDVCPECGKAFYRAALIRDALAQRPGLVGSVLLLLAGPLMLIAPAIFATLGIQKLMESATRDFYRSLLDGYWWVTGVVAIVTVAIAARRLTKRYSLFSYEPQAPRVHNICAYFMTTIVCLVLQIVSLFFLGLICMLMLGVIYYY